LTEAGGTGDHLAAIPWNAAWDAEVQSEVTDALNAYDPPTRADLTSDIGTVTTAISDVPTVAEFEARTLPSADYFVVGDYTAPANGDITAIKAKTDNLPSDPADQSAVEAAITSAQTAILNQGNSAWVTATGFLTSLGSTAPTNWINGDAIATSAVTKIQAGLSTFDGDLSGLATSTNVTDARDSVISAGLTATQVWSHAYRLLTGSQATNLAAIALIPTNPLLASSYIAPDNAGIGAIKVKTDQLIFSGGDIVATLAGEEVIVTSASVNAIVAGVNGSLTIPTAVQVRQEIDSNSVELAAIKAAAIAGKNLSAAGL
jgi:hypothetical protein